MTKLERYLWSVQPDESGCWRWNGPHHRLGYAQLAGQYAHRFAYEYYKGAIPDGLDIDHLCRVRDCVNPDHLEAVTHAENMRRSRLQQCGAGHAMTETNVYVTPRGQRHCRECGLIRDRAYRARKAAARQ